MPKQPPFSPNTDATTIAGSRSCSSNETVTLGRPVTRASRRRDPDLEAPEPLHPPRRGQYRSVGLRLLAELSRTLTALLNLLVPVECVCCGVEDAVLCSACARGLRALCKRPFRAEQESPVLVDVDGTARVSVVAAGPYREELAQVLLSFKHLGQWRLAAALAPCLAKAISAAVGPATDICLVPVPSSGGAFRKRGFSPVHILLATIRRRRLLPHCRGSNPLRKKVNLFAGRSVRQAVMELLLGAVGAITGDSGTGDSRQGRTTGQKGLGRGARARRVAGSMRVSYFWKAKLRGRRCLIVDDVLTTGATLAEAERAVRMAGGVVCGAVVLAATRPPAYASRPAEDEPAQTVKTQTKNKLPKDE